MKRSPLRSKTSLPPGGGLARQSKKRAARDAVYPQRRKQVRARAQGLCELRTPVCTGQGEQVHHLAGKGGHDPHRLDNLALACGECHRYAHSHPAESYANGWMRTRNGRAA